MVKNGKNLAAKRKSLPPDNSTGANRQKKTTSGNLTGGNPTLKQTTTNSSTEVIVIPDSPHKSSQDSSLLGPSSLRFASEPIVLDSTPEETHPVVTQPRSKIRPPALLCRSLSAFLITLAKVGYVQTSRKSLTEISPIIVAEQGSGSELLSTIDQDVQQALEDIDAEYI